MTSHNLFETAKVIQNTIRQHGLPDDFISTIDRVYRPLAQKLANVYRTYSHSQAGPSSAFFVGIQGSQGSGKSTCAAFLKLLLETEFDLTVLTSSIDDFYLTLQQRQELANSVHPLYATRGVPGTHDIELIHAMFNAASKPEQFTVPVFDKSQDDRAPREEWQTVQGPVDMVILEGWCVGVRAQAEHDLLVPRNALEQHEDAGGAWRRTINRALENEYKWLFSRLHQLIVLQAPSFDCVYEWRCLQEKKLIQRLFSEGLDASGAQTPEQLQRFIAHYQRLTEHALNTLPEYADVLLQLNKDHRFIETD